MAELVSGSLDSLIFWEAKAWSKKRSVEPFPDSACHLASLTWNPSNTKLAVVPRQGGRIGICEFQDDALSRTYLAHDGGTFSSGCLLHNSRYLASGSTDSTVHIWDLKNNTIFRTFPGHSSPVTSVTRSHNDHWIVSGGRNGSIIMHSVDSTTPWQLLQSLSEEPKTAINRLCFSHVEKGHFGSVSEDGVVCVWSVESQRLLIKYPSPHTSPATDLCFSPSNNMLMISVGMDSRIKCHDLQTRKIVTEVATPSPLTSVTMLKDGSTLLAGSADGKLYVYELRSVKYPKATLLGHKTAVTCITQQSYSKPSSHSKSSRSKGKRTPSNRDSSTPEGSIGDTPNSAYLGTASPSLNSSLGNHLQVDGASPSLDTDRSRTDSSAPKKDSVNITPYVTQPAAPTAKVNSEATKRSTGGESMATSGAVLHTPASNRAQTSSIFSPLDPNLVTPMLTKAPAVAATPTTIASTPSCTTPSTQSVSTTHAHPISTAALAETSSIFSPLDSGPVTHPRSLSSRQPVASPLLIAHTQPSKKPPPPYGAGGDPGGGGVGPGRGHLHGLQGGAKEEFDGDTSTPDHGTGMAAAAVLTTKTFLPTSQSQLSEILERSVQETPSNTALSSTQSIFSSLPDSASASATSSVDLFDHANAALTEQQSCAQAPPPLGVVVPPTNGIQMKYLENMIKEAHEETLEALHQDIRALSVDNTKFYYALQQQLAAQHAALVERMDKLSKEVKQVQELVYQYMPKH